MKHLNQTPSESQSQITTPKLPENSINLDSVQTLDSDTSPHQPHLGSDHLPSATNSIFKLLNIDPEIKLLPHHKQPDTFNTKIGLLRFIQRRFGLINLDGKVWLFDRISLETYSLQGVAAKLKLSPRQDGALLIKRALRAEYPKVSAKEIVETFWVSKQTAYYEGVEFNPKGISDKYLNLWVGPTLAPQKEIGL